MKTRRYLSRSVVSDAGPVLLSGIDVVGRRWRRIAPARRFAGEQRVFDGPQQLETPRERHGRDTSNQCLPFDLTVFGSVDIENEPHSPHSSKRRASGDLVRLSACATSATTGTGPGCRRLDSSSLGSFPGAGPLLVPAARRLRAEVVLVRRVR